MILRGNNTMRQCGGIGVASTGRDAGAKAPQFEPSGQSLRSHIRRGFTLIELLVVIAIIGILAAIIFPVFSTIEENSREGNTMSHLHDISAALALYKLDNHKYPPVLFAYACDANASGTQTVSSNAPSTDTSGAYKGDSCNVNDTMASIAGDTAAKNELVGLYPEYVKDWHDFTCANDTVNDPYGTNKTDTTSGSEPQPNYIQANGSLEHAYGTVDAPYRSYFTADAFDVNPQIETANQFQTGSYNNLNYVIRYQTSWTSWDGNYDPDTLTTSPTTTTTPFDTVNYARQLCWQNPPANTFVTAVTDHVPNANRLLILYADGTAVKKPMQLGPWYSSGFDEVGGSQAMNGQPGRNTSNANIIPVTDTTDTNPAATLAQGTESATNPNSTYVQSGFWQYNVGP